MGTKGKRLLENSMNQDKLFDSVNEDIHEIMRGFDFKNCVFVNQNKVGELTIEVQDPIPSNLIKKLNEYMGFESVIDKTPHYITITYKIN